MPTRCDRCGNESYVIYVKPNPGNICEECEDEERRIKGMPGDWDTIRKNNKQRNYRRNYAKRCGNGRGLPTVIAIAGGGRPNARHCENDFEGTQAEPSQTHPVTAMSDSTPTLAQMGAE